ncbi:MAG: hypothetical protein PHW04_04280 [Candidatus Wallbacteria bacterium]|nr:hypothetical protein [Candidatus Wallbacteria bacterium]
MRKITGLVLAVLFLLMGTVCFAGQDKAAGMREKVQMDRQIIETNDGGIVVLQGNLLFKFDKNLKPVAQTDIKPGLLNRKVKAKNQKVTADKPIKRDAFQACCERLSRQCRGDMQKIARHGKNLQSAGLKKNAPERRKILKDQHFRQVQAAAWKQNHLNNLNRERPAGKQNPKFFAQQRENRKALAAGKSLQRKVPGKNDTWKKLYLANLDRQKPLDKLFKNQQKAVGHDRLLMQEKRNPQFVNKTAFTPGAGIRPPFLGQQNPGRKVVSLKDGGIVILTGNRLVKFDARLKKVGETKIKPNPKFQQKQLKKTGLKSKHAKKDGLKAPLGSKIDKH